MALPVSFYSETIADNTVKSNGQPETATWSVAVPTITNANIVAETALIVALQAAVNGLTLGAPIKDEIVSARNQLGTGPAASLAAQRENKFLIRYHGATTGSKFRVSLPTADLTLLTPHTEFVDITAGPGLALKTAWEAVVVSPDNSTETTIVDSIQFVGRNT